MFKRSLFLFIIALLITASCANAQPDSVIITGRLKDTSKEGDMFTCNVIPPGAPLLGGTFFSKYYRTVISKGRFRLAIPSLYDWFDVTFASFDKEGYSTFYNNGSNTEITYLLQKGDQVNLIIQPGGLIDFFGKAAARLTCQENIAGLHYMPESASAAIDYLYRTKRYAAAYSYTLKFLKTQVEMKRTILEAYRQELPAPVYERFCSDITGQSYYPTLYEVLAVSWGKDTALIGASKVFLAQLKTAMPSPDSSRAAMSSSYYADLLLYSAVNEITFNAPGDSVRKMTFAALFGLISREYTGVLRDKLLFLVFLNYARKAPDSISYLDKAFAEMKDDESTDLLHQWAANHLEGAPAYAFDLPDENGKRFTLNDFRGKIIVADFWFYGCEGCAQVPAAMAGVYRKYAGNPKVVFLSINVDREKTTWKSGLKSGQYAIPGSVHLSLMGLGHVMP